MSRVFITGSSDGLGKMAAKLLIQNGHSVIAHARNPERAATMNDLAAEAVVIGDLASIAETKSVAEQVNRLGKVDAVIHNAGMGYREPGRGNSPDGLPPLFAVNSLAPYILTSLIDRPARLIYVSSGLHRSGDASLQDLTWTRRTWNGFAAYSDSKLHNVLLAFAVARKWTKVYSNALEPGWVATKMGGPGAPDSLEEGPKTQAWLATSDDKGATVSGKYFFHQKLRDHLKAADDPDIQENFLKQCEDLSGIRLG